MSQIPATPDELKIAFAANRRFGQEENTPVHYLLRFYAAECGLKWKILHDRRAPNNAQVPEAKVHDLESLAKAAKAPRALPGGPPPPSMPGRLHLARGGGGHKLEMTHQAWRYGIEVEAACEQQLIAWLDAVCYWVEGEMRR